MGRAETAGEAYLSVEKTAEGILRLAGMVEGRKALPHRRHSHRYVLQLLENCADGQRSYEELIATFAVRRQPPTKKTWDEHWSGVVRSIAGTIAGDSLASPQANFLEWEDVPDGSASPSVARKTRDNIFQYPNEDPKVRIRTGSIHSVKGETHTAALVLETYWKGGKGRHNLELLSPWVSGDHSGAMNSGVQQQFRLKLHYVAMTRPTHLLCLAMKRSVFEDSNGTLDAKLVKEHERRGWHIKSV